jgi:hypothetical protein
MTVFHDLFHVLFHDLFHDLFHENKVGRLRPYH